MFFPSRQFTGLTLCSTKPTLKPKPNRNKPKKRINPKSPAQQEPSPPHHPQPQTSNPAPPHQPRQARKKPKRTKTEQERQHLNPAVMARKTIAEHLHQVNKVPHPVDRVPNRHLVDLPRNPLAQSSPARALPWQLPRSAPVLPPRPLWPVSRPQQRNPLSSVSIFPLQEGNVSVKKNLNNKRTSNESNST